MKQYPLLIVLLVSGIALAATCAEDAFVDACQNCQFDEYGKMNQTCYESYQARGQTCVGTAYPGMATQYIMGGCPAIEACASNLQLCKNLYTTGNDSKDCELVSNISWESGSASRMLMRARITQTRAALQLKMKTTYLLGYLMLSLECAIWAL